MEIPPIEYRGPDDKEFCAIKNVDFGQFLEFTKLNKDFTLESIRLPLNNPEAYQYLRWVNEHLCDDYGCYLNYLLNIWDETCSVKPVRPPTPREVAIFNSRRIVELADNKELSDPDRNMYIDMNAEGIRDAYLYWNYSIWISSGLAGCILKFGTFENNMKPGDEYQIWEEWNT